MDQKEVQHTIQACVPAGMSNFVRDTATPPMKMVRRALVGPAKPKRSWIC
jgi:hypothetical protein